MSDTELFTRLNFGFPVLCMCPASFFNLFYFIHIGVLFCFHICLWEGVGSRGTGVTDSCELPCGCWESIPGPLEEESVLLTTELSLQPLCPAFCLSE